MAEGDNMLNDLSNDDGFLEALLEIGMDASIIDLGSIASLEDTTAPLTPNPSQEPEPAALTQQTKEWIEYDAIKWLSGRLQPIVEANSRANGSKDTLVFPRDMEGIVTAFALYAAIGKPIGPPPKIDQTREYKCKLCGQPLKGHECSKADPKRDLVAVQTELSIDPNLEEISERMAEDDKRRAKKRAEERSNHKIRLRDGKRVVTVTRSLPKKQKKSRKDGDDERQKPK